MLKFYDEGDIEKCINTDIISGSIRSTKRNGNSIALKALVFNCIRELYFEIIDSPRLPPVDIDKYKLYYWTAPLGSAIHEKMQSLMKLDKQKYTEKLMTFSTFAPDLYIRTKSDGIDMRDPDNIILYEFKTKSKIPPNPIKEELIQNLLSVFLYRREEKIDIKGSSMVYILREDPSKMRFFYYNFVDKNSFVYLDIAKNLKDIIDKIQELIISLRNKTPPSLNSKYIVTSHFTGIRCFNCPYREICKGSF